MGGSVPRRCVRVEEGDVPRDARCARPKGKRAQLDCAGRFACGDGGGADFGHWSSATSDYQDGEVQRGALRRRVDRAAAHLLAGAGHDRLRRQELQQESGELDGATATGSAVSDEQLRPLAEFPHRAVDVLQPVHDVGRVAAGDTLLRRPRGRAWCADCAARGPVPGPCRGGVRRRHAVTGEPGCNILAATCVCWAVLIR
mmetsp:Transcript_73735/g.192372  ORF Transcript_73735/g.192372 Transcript_73735/m.192372 type:complete len:200 (+) Transcript_73735:734-1333(+)